MLDHVWMRRAAIVVGAIAVTIAIALPIYFEPEGHTTYDKEKTSEQPQNEPAPLTGDIAGYRIQVSSIYQSKCERPENRDDADLCEQQRSASAAEKIVWWTRLQFIVSALTIGFLGWTVYESRRTADAAVKAAEAIPILERAFVFAKSFDWDSFSTQDGKFSHIVAYIRWENTGTTRTKNMLTHVSWQLFENGDIAEDFKFPDIGSEKKTPLMIGPKSSIRSANLEIPASVFEKVAAGGKLYVWAWADYDDIFNASIRHRTEFCSQIIALGLKPDGSPHLTVAIHDKHNGADDECLRHPNPYVRPA